MSNKLVTIDDYLATVDDEKRAVLQQLREQIREWVPEAIETISYGIPCFRVHHRGLVSFSAAKKHCSLHVMDKKIAEEFREDLSDFKMTVASIHFSGDKPIPEALLKRLILARVEANRAASE
ncbi:DUF1801 domain-containing protein [bacterium]|nr:DUF1801 domain-containing protein [bacterium]